MSPEAKRQLLSELVELHRRVDLQAGRLARRHGERLRCGHGCHDCCVDGLSVFTLEAERIRHEYAELLASGRPHPPGACALLDASGGCRVYASRPYVCRTQGLPLRWLEHEADGQTLELRDICPLNDEQGPPLEQLPASDCWTLGEHEARLAQLQQRWTRRLERVELRQLFVNRAP